MEEKNHFKDGCLSFLQVHPGHRHGQTQRNPQQVQNDAAGVRLQQQGSQRSGEESYSELFRVIQKQRGGIIVIIRAINVGPVFAADEDHGEGERHL